MSDSLKSKSKFLSLVLRHQPEIIGLQLDKEGWADMDVLISATNRNGHHFTKELIFQIVATNDKQRFALSTDRTRIRANQGHSVKIDLGLEPQAPPDLLYHGTAAKFLPAILVQGLLPQARQHVHLSALPDTAKSVGSRHGKPVILKIRALEMHSQGHVFYCAENGVWLTAAVHPSFFDVDV